MRAPSKRGSTHDASVHGSPGTDVLDPHRPGRRHLARVRHQPDRDRAIGIQHVDTLSNGRVMLRPGTMYGALDRLADAGVIALTVSDEIVGVLLDAGAPDQRWPSVRRAGDLLSAGRRVRSKLTSQDRASVAVIEGMRVAVLVGLLVQAAFSVAMIVHRDHVAAGLAPDDPDILAALDTCRHRVAVRL